MFIAPLNRFRKRSGMDSPVNFGVQPALSARISRKVVGGDQMASLRGFCKSLEAQPVNWSITCCYPGI